MSAVHKLIIDHLDIWTVADTEKKSGRGRASGNANSVYGIKKLRELILELAVRGKLVPQDPNDEPAFELLKRLNEDNLLLVNEGKIKKERSLPAITQEEKLFEIPSNWEWVRLDDIGSTFIGLTYSPKDITDVGIPVLRSSNIQNGKIDLTDLVRVSANIKSNLFVNHGDLLICARNGSKSLVGKTAMIKDLNEPMVFGAFMAIYKSRFNCYVEVFLNSPIFRKFLDGVATTTINQITQNNLKTTSIPIPPLAEQHRIVAKVDELMALCDQLEAQHNNAADAHEQLVSHLLSTLTQSQDAADFNANWQRIATHFDTLFTTESSIENLKKAILELAASGKLTTPKKSDFDIREQLDEILLARKNLNPSKKELESIHADYDEALAGIHNNRAYLRTRFFCDFITKGTTPPPNELLSEGEVPFLKVYNIIENRLNFSYRPIFISTEVHRTKLNRSKIFPGDIVMNIVGPPLGKIAMVTDEYPEWNMNQALAVFRPVAKIFNEYLYYMLSTTSILRSVLLDVKGTAGQDNLSLEQCRDLIIPIPSIQEQHRIVNKVNELMNLCEELKARISGARQYQKKLADVLVENSL